MIKTTFTREELYDLVWSEPLIRLAKKYEISDNGLRKICKRLNIPLPEYGYWMKLKYNKPVRNKQLPQNYSGEKEAKLSERDLNSLTTDSAKSKKKELLKEYEKLDKKLFQVPLKLTNPDRQILAAQKTLASGKASEYDNWLVYTHREEIMIKVAPNNVNRALRIFDTIIKLLRFRGHELVIHNWIINAVVFGEEFEISIREKLRFEVVVDERYSWHSRKFFPTNRLIFKIDKFHIKEFIDNKKTLEEQIPDILAELEYRGQKERAERIEREIRRAKEKEDERLRQELEERKEQERQNFMKLIKESKSWHKSNILYAYINAIEANANEKDIMTDELKEWLVWAKKKADWYNPFLKAEDDLLNDKDRLKFL
jgi:hypothetical protein